MALSPSPSPTSVQDPTCECPEPGRAQSPFISRPVLDLSILPILSSQLLPEDLAKALAGTSCPSPLREAEERCADSSVRPGLCLCVPLGLQDVWATWTQSQAGE